MLASIATQLQNNIPVERRGLDFNFECMPHFETVPPEYQDHFMTQFMRADCIHASSLNRSADYI